jgi:hypothetical protein
MNSALQNAHETSRDTPDRHEPDGARSVDEPARPVRDRVDVDWLLEHGPDETKSRPGSTRGISGVVED